MFSFIDTQQENHVIKNYMLFMFKFNFYKSRVLKTLNLQGVKSGIFKIRHIEENYVEMIFRKMGESNKSILSLASVFDLKKKVLFTLIAFKKPFGWVAFFHQFFKLIF